LVQYSGKSLEGFTFTTNTEMKDETAAFKTFKSNFADNFDK